MRWLLLSMLVACNSEGLSADVDASVDLAAPLDIAKPSPPDLLGLRARFEAPQELPTPCASNEGLRDIRAGDFDGDGHRDIAVLCGGSIQVLLGDGNGGLASPIASNGLSMATQVADIDGDAADDLVGDTANGVGVFLSNRDGTFRMPATYGPDGWPVVSDFNADGHIDIAIAGNNTTASLTMLLGDGAGNFVAQPTIGLGKISVDGVTTGDFNGDGNIDLALSVSDVMNLLWVLPGFGDGGFDTTAPMIPAPGPADLFAGDFNNDGALDLAGGLDMWFNTGSRLGMGTRAPAVLVTSSQTAHLNRDGNLDIVAPNRGSFWAMLGVGDGTFVLRSGKAGTDVGALAAGDFNGDGLDDVVVTDFMKLYLVMNQGP